MSIGSFEGRRPTIGAGTWVHPTAEVFGDVVLGEQCWVGPGARLRGDYGRIVIGDCTAVEDNCVIHARPGEVCTVGAWVTIGHAAVIHTARSIGDYAVIGMAAVVSDYAVVGSWAVVGEGAVVPQGTTVPARRIAVGVPARLLDRAVEDDFIAEWTRFKGIYVDLAARYATGFQSDAS